MKGAPLTNRLRVLIVDDEVGFRDALALAIEDEGIDVWRAMNGQQALAILDTITPDVIVLDLHMPVMNGQTFLNVYRKRFATPAPVIICSTRQSDAKLANLSVAAKINKPVDIDELLDVIQNVAARRVHPTVAAPHVRTKFGHGFFRPGLDALAGSD